MMARTKIRRYGAGWRRPAWPTWWRIVGRSVCRRRLNRRSFGLSTGVPALLLLGPEDGGGLGACRCPGGGRCDEVRQRQRGGDGDEDGGERDGWLGQHAELAGENAPCPPAARDAGGQPDQQRDRGDGGGLPRDGMPDLPPDEAECLQDRQVAAPAAGGAGKHMGQRPGGDQGQQPGKRDWRSEEHTSELQSQSNLVCRL